MKATKAHFRFKIDVFSPETLPLSRFAEYVKDLADLFGHQDNVHFVKLAKSSAIPIVSVDYTAVPKVRLRLRQVKRGDAPEDAAQSVSQHRSETRRRQCGWRD